ncbi:MAG: transposase [Candidatus Bathycorpusculaceae bacterium]
MRLQSEKAGPAAGTIVVADKAYDAEHCHVYVREKLRGYSIIPPGNKDAPVWKTYGRYRKKMKRGYPEALYRQRSKDETVFSVVKRLMTEHLASRLVRTQNRELAFRLIAYNIHRLINKT